PIGISVGVVSILGRAGSHVLFTIGPFDATLEGLDFALRIAFRLVVLALALALFAMTTTARSLVVDLERRGVSRRFAFAAAATLDAIPAMAERAAAIQAAQRARSPAWRRAARGTRGPGHAPRRRDAEPGAGGARLRPAGEAAPALGAGGFRPATPRPLAARRRAGGLRRAVGPRRPAAAALSRSMLELRGVRYRYPGFERHVIDGVDLTVGDGEVVGLTGPNGTGKSTLC